MPSAQEIPGGNLWQVKIGIRINKISTHQPLSKIKKTSTLKVVMWNKIT